MKSEKEFKNLEEFKKWENFEAYFKSLCQFDRENGMEFKTLEDGKIEYQLKILPKHLSSPDIAHGGVIAALMDAILGITALSVAVPLGYACSTVEFKINYFAPTHLHDLLIARGQVDFKGQSLIVTSAEIFIHTPQQKSDLKTDLRSEQKIDLKNDHKLVAKGMGTYNLYPLSKKIKDSDSFLQRMS